MSLILHDKRCCPVKVSNAGKIHTMLRFVDARFAFVPFILDGPAYPQQNHTASGFVLGFSGFGSPFGVQPPDVMPEACEQQRHVRSGRGGSEADAQ